MKLKSLIFLCLFLSVTGVAKETFIIEFSSNTISIISADQVRDEYNVIVKNRMMTPLKARIESLDLKQLIPVSVPVNKDRTYKIKWGKDIHYRFLPLSPPFEEIRLKVGQEKYEIPPKK